MKKILVVDDEKEVRDLIKDKLTQSKYAVMTASTGQEALIICKMSHPDLVLLDIAMPEMDGYATCEKLKQDPKTKDIPVLFLTGKDLQPEGITERCNTLGAYGHISKLSTLKDLLERIQGIIGKAIILFFFLACLTRNSLAQNVNTTSQIQRSQEVISEEETLRQEIEKETKVFIKKVFINGVNLLTKDEVKDIILPFQKRWLAKSDIQQIMDLLKGAYKEKGYNDQPIKISYKIEKGCLRIFVEEKIK